MSKQLIGSIVMNFEKFKNALKLAEEKRQEELKQDIAKVRNIVEKILTLAMENTANLSRAKYAGLEMF